jgi:uncharacterized protein
MPDSLKPFYSQLQQLCQHYQVKTLEVFGSASRREDFVAESDVDLIVEFAVHPELNVAEQYFDFKESLEKLFNRPVDLLMAKAIKNPYFLRAITAERQVIYGH